MVRVFVFAFFLCWVGVQGFFYKFLGEVLLQNSSWVEVVWQDFSSGLYDTEVRFFKYYIVTVFLSVRSVSCSWVGVVIFFLLKKVKFKVDVQMVYLSLEFQVFDRVVQFSF